MAERPGYIKLEEDKTGFIKWFNYDKGYGFIGVNGEEDVFVHKTHVSFDPVKNDRVKFAIAWDKRRNRVYAVEVELA